jgi:hypothetical protein
MEGNVELLKPTQGKPLTSVFLAVLALAWIMVMLPAMIRARGSAPLISAKRWRRRMKLISPRPSNAGRWVVVNSTHCNARPKFRRALMERRRKRRRQRVLKLLALAAVASGAYAAMRQGAWLEVHIALDVVLALYVVGLRESARRRRERSRKVHSLAARRRTVPAEVFGLTAAGGRNRL